MQAIFSGREALAGALASTISKPRFKRYMYASGGDKMKALAFYQWNIELAQAMYFPINVWEIALRNRLNTFLTRRYGVDWPYSVTLIRDLTVPDRLKLAKARDRQERARGKIPAATPAIVADLSAGFWVSLLSASYEVPFSWTTTIGRVFPYDAALDRATAHQQCSALLIARNRIAHHEAIFQMPLAALKADAEALVNAMCPGAKTHLDGKCTLSAALARSPA